MTGSRPAAPTLAVYVHWPFCEKKCPYCDFNSHVAERAVDHAAWRDALLADLAHEAADTPGAVVGSIFFGGGTPSLMAPETAAAVIDAVRGHWRVTDDLEVTLEANPSSAEAARFQSLAQAGVNRISLGVQAFDDAALRFLGRVHDLKQAENAIGAAHAAVGRVSFDLIYARPEQTAAGWRAELDRAQPFLGEHVSAYQLTIEPGTPFFRESVPAADEDTAEELFDLTGDVLSGWGYPPYEVSNHARPGAACRHNVHIWRGGAYVGIGPGAHGRVRLDDGTWSARHRIHGPARWMAAVSAAGHGTGKAAALNARTRAEEIVMTALRLSDGFDTGMLRYLTGLDAGAVIDADARSRLMSGGLLTPSKTHLQATPSGAKVLNGLVSAVLGGTSSSD